MYGMELMSDAVSPLADMPEFASLLTAFQNPLLGVLVGAVFTGIIQSSAASVGILQALALTGSITYGMAIPHHHGPEYRYLRHRAAQLHRCQPQRKAGGGDPHLLQRHRHCGVP